MTLHTTVKESERSDARTKQVRALYMGVIHDPTDDNFNALWNPVLMSEIGSANTKYEP